MTSQSTFPDLVRDALTRVPQMACEELRRAATPNLVVLDVREADEAAQGTVPGAVRVPRGLLERHAHEHVRTRDTPVLVFSGTGERSALAADSLLKMGYQSVRTLTGGFERWRHAGFPVAATNAACALPGGKLDWAQVRREFAIVSRRVPVLGAGERPLVYLDHAASTHAPTSVLKAYTEFLEREYANIHRGTHLLSRKASERFDEAYYVVADFIGAELRNGCVCFTSNTTQAIDLASYLMADRPGKVMTTEMEHHSNDLTHRRNGSVLRARVTDSGALDLDHMQDLLRKNEVKLVAVTAGSNVTGIMPDLALIARMAHENGALILVDAAQGLARHRIRVGAFDDPSHLDFVAGAGHKAYAPFGVGFLYGPRAVMDQAAPYIPGGGTAKQVAAQSAEYMAAPDRHHGGTPNIAGVVGMASALTFLQSIGLEEIRRHEVKLLSRMLKGFEELGGVTVYGPPDPEQRLGVVAFNVNGVTDLLTAAVLSEEGAIAVRNGRFCSHLYVDRLLSAKRAQAQAAGQEPDVNVTGAVRASVGLYNDDSDVDRLLEFVKRVRDHKWVGHYRVKGDTISAEFAGRCADRWMEATQVQEPDLIPTDSASFGYAFEVLQADGACRSYLIADTETGDAAIVDPLRQKVDSYLDLLQAHRWRLRYTIETHTHADHLSGSARLKDLTGASMAMHEGSPAPCVDKPLKDGDVIALGKLKIEVLATPGHTNDAVSLLLPGRVLTGDSLLIGGCGRTDLPTGDAEAMFETLRRLAELPEETLVFPTHDYDGRQATTIGREKRNNPRLVAQGVEAFTAALNRIQLPVPLGLDEMLNTNQNCL